MATNETNATPPAPVNTTSAPKTASAPTTGAAITHSSTSKTPAVAAAASRQLVEPREKTDEPLVERRKVNDGKDTELVPVGRRRAIDLPKFTDEQLAVLGPASRNAFGLTQPENVALHAAIARLNTKAKLPPTYTVEGVEYSTHLSEYEFLTDDEARFARDFDEAELEQVVAEYRVEHPLPTSWSPLPDGDPRSNYVQDAAPAFAASATAATSSALPVDVVE